MSHDHDPLVLLTASSTKFHVGADECGLGSLAGPMVVCAVISASRDSKCRDSKKYSGKTAAEKLSKMERDISNSDYLRHVVHMTPPDKLVQVGYHKSLSTAYRSAVSAVRLRVGAAPHVSPATIDGSLTHSIPYAAAYPKADSISPLVSLASCIGKCRQIEGMLKLAERYPEYGFQVHCGYGTEGHIEAIKKYGLIVGVHRIPIITKMERFAGHRFSYNKDLV